MAKEYIEREKALEKVIEVKHHDPELSGVVLHRYIKEIDLKDIPAADVAPVVHGRWIEKTAHDRRQYFECSNCGKQENKHTAIRGGFCWNCGAKMDKEEADDKKQPEEAPGE